MAVLGGAVGLSLHPSLCITRLLSLISQKSIFFSKNGFPTFPLKILWWLLFFSHFTSRRPPGTFVIVPNTPNRHLVAHSSPFEVRYPVYGFKRFGWGRPTHHLLALILCFTFGGYDVSPWSQTECIDETDCDLNSLPCSWLTKFPLRFDSVLGATFQFMLMNPNSIILTQRSDFIFTSNFYLVWEINPILPFN
jgi:hypothetical protein